VTPPDDSKPKETLIKSKIAAKMEGNSPIGPTYMLAMAYLGMGRAGVRGRCGRRMVVERRGRKVKLFTGDTYVSKLEIFQ
jgi:hypothetical protein